MTTYAFPALHPQGEYRTQRFSLDIKHRKAHSPFPSLYGGRLVLRNSDTHNFRSFEFPFYTLLPKRQQKTLTTLLKRLKNCRMDIIDIWFFPVIKVVH